MTKSNIIRFQHILEAIERIEGFTKEGFTSGDEKTASAVFYQLTVIGEAVRHIPKEYHERFSDIPWKQIIGLRNFLVHEYFAIAIGRIQGALTELSQIKIRVKAIIEELSHEKQP